MYCLYVYIVSMHKVRNVTCIDLLCNVLINIILLLMSSVQSLLVNVVLPSFGSFLFTVVSYMKSTVIILFVQLHHTFIQHAQ